MFDFKDILENNRIFIAILSLFSVFRMYLGMNMSIFMFPNAIHDDLLMFDYSNLAMHFTHWNIQSLSKDIAYPIFLFFVKLLNISYRFWIVLLWIIAALLVIYDVYNYLTKNRILILALFLFVLFLPVGFDIVSGQRVYRNAIMVPFAVIFLAMLYIFINKLLDSQINIKSTLVGGGSIGINLHI